MLFPILQATKRLVYRVSTSLFIQDNPLKQCWSKSSKPWVDDMNVNKAGLLSTEQLVTRMVVIVAEFHDVGLDYVSTTVIPFSRKCNNFWGKIVWCISNVILLIKRKPMEISPKRAFVCYPWHCTCFFFCKVLLPMHITVFYLCILLFVELPNKMKWNENPLIVCTTKLPKAWGTCSVSRLRPLHKP